MNGLNLDDGIDAHGSIDLQQSRANREEEINHDAVISIALRSLEIIPNLLNLKKKCVATIIEYLSPDETTLALTSLFLIAHHPPNNKIIKKAQNLLIEMKIKYDRREDFRVDRVLLKGEIEIDLREILLGRSFKEILKELVSITQLASDNGIQNFVPLEVSFKNSYYLKEAVKDPSLIYLCTHMNCSLIADALASTLFRFYAQQGEKVLFLFNTENTWLSIFFQVMLEKLPITYYRNDYNKASINKFIKNELEFCKLFLREGYILLVYEYLKNLKINFTDHTPFNCHLDPSILPYDPMGEEHANDLLRHPRISDYCDAILGGYILSVRVDELKKLSKILIAKRRPDIKTKRAIEFINIIIGFFIP